MDAHNFANTINNLFRSLVPVASSDDDSDMPPLEPIPSPAGSSSSTAQNNGHSDLNSNNPHDDDEDMPELQSVSNSSNEDDSEDANEVEMQAVADDNDSAWTDESASNVAPLEPIYPVPSTSNPNRRARVDEDEDEERDRRHPSQRVGNPINLTTTTTTTATTIPSDPTSPVPPTEQPQQQPAPPTFPGPRVRATINIPGLVRTPTDASRQQQQQQQPPQGAPAPANAPGAGANTPAQQPLFGGFAITIDLNGTPTLHPLLPGAPPHAHAHAHAHPEAGPHGHQPIPGGFAAFREFLGLFGVGAEREVEDPERAQRLVDALEEVPIGLVRRLESLGKDGEGQGAGAAGGDVGCAICWDRLLDGDGEGFGPVEKEMATTTTTTEAEAEEAAIVGDEAMTMADSTSTLEKEALAPASAEPLTKQYPKIVSLPCAHVFHAACLIPWFSRPRQTTCPTCRFNVDPEGLTARRRTLGDGMFGENAPQQRPQAAAGPTAAQVVGHAPGERGEAVTDEQEAVGGVVMWDDTEVERVRAQIEQRTREVRERRQRERELATAGGGEEGRPEADGDVPTAPASRDGEREEAGGDETPQQQPVAPAPMPGAGADANQQGPQQAPGQGQGQRPQTGFLTIGFDVFIRGGPIAFGPQDSTFAPAAGPAQGNANQGANGNARPDANSNPNPTANANLGPNPNPNPNPNPAAPPRPLQTPGFPGVIMPMPMMQGMGMMEMDAMMSEMDMDEEEAMMADMGMDGMGGMGGVGMGGGGGGGVGGPEDEAEAQVAWAEFLQGVGMGQQGEGNVQGPQQQQQQQHGQGQGQGQGQQPLPPWMRGNAGGGQFVGGMERTMEGVLGSLFTGAAGQGQAQPQAQDQGQAQAQGQEQNGAANGNAGQGQGQDQGPGQLGEFLARFFGHLGAQAQAQAQAQAPDAGQGQGQQAQAGGVPLNPPNANAGPQFGMPPFASMFPGLHMNPPMNPPLVTTAAAPGLGALQAAQPPVPPLAFVAGFPTTVRFQPQPQPQPHAHPHLHPHAQVPPPPPLPPRGPAPFFTPPGLRVPREKKAWSLPPAPGPTLRQRIERREREAGLRCCDVSCGVGPSDEEPVAVLTEAAKRQLSIHAPHRHMWEGEKEERGGEDERERSLCPHTFHPACLVSAARVALMGAEVKEVDGDVEVACSVCRGVGNVARGDWDEGVKALE